MISVDATYKKDKMTAFVDLGAGSRVDQYNSNSTNLFNKNYVGSDILLKQAYISYEITSDLSVTAGSWKKHIGYEQINAVDNGNYSMSYGFSNTNFFNTGVKLDYKLDKFNFMIGVVNPADFRTAINSGSTKKNYIGQFGYNRENTKFIYGVQTFGVVGFPNNAVQNDLIIEQKFDEKLTLAVNITNTNYWTNFSKSWNSAAVYVKYAVEENLNSSKRSLPETENILDILLNWLCFRSFDWHENKKNTLKAVKTKSRKHQSLSLIFGWRLTFWQIVT